MGAHASTSQTIPGKLVFVPKRKGPKYQKVKIDILAFEVSSVMSKCVQLWQSLSEQEVCRLRDEIRRSEGVLNLVSNNESFLLSFACFEKIQDLTWVALAVARLGKRCHEPALTGFEYIYMDILKQNIDTCNLGFSSKEMDAKMKKMERYIAATANLYQEMEVLSEMERALQRLQDEGDPVQKDSLFTLEQKVGWQKQEVKYLKELSLWNQAFDKVAGLLAGTVCTVYGRIVTVFGFPIFGWSQILSVMKNGEMLDSLSLMNFEVEEFPKLSSSSVKHDFAKPSNLSVNKSVKFGNMSVDGLETTRNYYMEVSIRAKQSPVHQMNTTASPLQNGLISSSVHHAEANCSSDSFSSLSLCFNPRRQFSQHRGPRLSRSASSSIATPVEDCCKSWRNSGFLFPGSGPIWETVFNKTGTSSSQLLFDTRNRLQNAPPSMLGGSGLALHYANVIILVEKMVKCPHLISQDARDDLYQMLPKSMWMALRAGLRSSTRRAYFHEFNNGCDADWRESLEKILGWLAPLAHNMIHWQSEHNFEQQQAVSRTNVLLLQTLYFADQAKAEAALVEVLVGLNHLWRHDRDSEVIPQREDPGSKELEYLEWQL